MDQRVVEVPIDFVFVVDRFQEGDALTVREESADVGGRYDMHGPDVYVEELEQ